MNYEKLLIFLFALSLMHCAHRETKIKDLKRISSEENEIVENQRVYLSNTRASAILTNALNIGMSDNAGAINCLVIDETDSTHLLAGAQNGGIWKSINRGVTWLPLNDYANTLKVSSIAQNHFRHNEFYYCSGIDIFSANGLPLNDLNRSMDNGNTFTPLMSAGPVIGRVNKIMCSPVDSNTVYFAQYTLSNYGGLYKTTDDFLSIKLVYRGSSYFCDFTVLSTGEVMVADQNKIYQSLSGDSGTFVNSSNGLAANISRIFVAACDSQPLIRYAFAGYYSIFTAAYKSVDGGNNWSFLDTISNGEAVLIKVKPDDPNVVVCGNVQTYGSIDGGSTWIQSNTGYDIRSYTFDPTNTDILFTTSDFGISSNNLSANTSNSFSIFKDYDSTLYVQEIHAGDYYATGLRSLIGCQDIGTNIIRDNLKRQFLLGGDGSYAYCSKQDSNSGFISYQGGTIQKVTSFATQSYTPSLHQLDTNNDMQVDEGAVFIHPYYMNDANDQQLFFPTLRRLWRSIDGGINWSPVSNYYGNTLYRLFLTGTSKPNPNIFWSNYDSIFVLMNAVTAVQNSEYGFSAPQDLKYIRSDANNDSSIFIIAGQSPVKAFHSSSLQPGNISWTDITVNFPTNITPACITSLPGNDQVIFIGTLEGGIYATTDGGLTWTKESGIPYVQIKEIKIRPSDKKVFIYTYGRGAWTADISPSLKINETEQLKIQLFPNPFSEKLFLSGIKNVNYFIIYDFTGKIIFKKERPDENFTIEYLDLKAGIYYLTFCFEGKKIFTTKIAKMN